MHFGDLPSMVSIYKMCDMSMYICCFPSPLNIHDASTSSSLSLFIKLVVPKLREIIKNLQCTHLVESIIFLAGLKIAILLVCYLVE